MNSTIITSLCLGAWVVTLARFRTIPWKDLRKDIRIVLNVLMLLFYSITLTFLVGGVANFVDAHTFHNFSALIAYCSILVAIYFGTVAFLGAIETPTSGQIIRWLWLPLVVAVTMLMAIYASSMRQLPEWQTPDASLPQSLPQAVFMFIMFTFAGTMCFILGKEYLGFLPLEKATVIRLRVIATIVCTFTGVAYFLVKITLLGGYFWPFLASPSLINFSLVLFFFSVFSWAIVLLNNQIYARFVTLSRNAQSWSAFRDLKYLIGLLQQLCPEVALSTKTPSLWEFLLNPEYHLYRDIVFIMDSKAMLGDFLSEPRIPGQSALWGDKNLQEAVRVNQILQSINPSDEFWEIVEAYRRASRDLLRNSYIAPEVVK